MRALWIIAFSLPLLFLANLLWGSVHIPLESFWEVLSGSDNSSMYYKIIVKGRLPQAITACLAGSGLATGGLLMQTLFRNPLAGPSILGISSGASLGVALVMLLGSITGWQLGSVFVYGQVISMAAAFVGALSVLLVLLAFAKVLRNNALLLILGIMLGYITSSIISILQFYATDEGSHAFVLWGLGDFSSTTLEHLKLFAPMVLLGLFGALLLIKPLNLLVLGENYAKNLGLNTQKARKNIIMITGLLTAVITAYCGPIAFLGLAVPHITKLFSVSSNHRILLPYVMAFGMIIALLCNVIARLPGLEGALPINAVTSLIGAPIVISILIKRRHA